MKAIFVIPKMSGGGAEKVISVLANHMVDRNIAIDVLMTAGDTVEYSLDSRVNLRCIGGTTGGNIFKVICRIIKMHSYFKESENKKAVIISFGPGTSAYVVLALLGLKNRLIISERSDPAVCPHPVLRNMVYSRANKLVFQTNMAINCFPAKIIRKSVVIPNPVRLNIPQPYFDKRENTIVAVGRLEEMKNYSLLLEAFKEFVAYHRDYSLHIYGKGSLEKVLKDKAYNELRLNCDEVTFEGFCEDVNDRIRTAGMYVLSSNFEGLSNALLEAMAMGLPVISTDCPIGGSAMCIENNVNGILVPVRSKKELTEAMKYVAEHDKEAALMGRNASKIRDKYSEHNIVNMWIKLLEN